MDHMIGVWISVRAGTSACCCTRYSLRETYGALVGKTIALGAGGSEPLATTPLCFLHVRLAKKNTAAARSNRTKVAPMLTPEVAPFERPEELPPPGELCELEAEAGVDSTVVAVVSGVVFGPVKVMEMVGEGKLWTALDAVDVLECADEAELVEIPDVDVVVCVACDFLNGAALLGLLESFAATTSSAGHSVSQALEEQHPKKGLSNSKHVYHFPLGSRHSWFVMFSPLFLLKLEYRTSSSGQCLGRQS